jgi:HD-GYP domain-containing protein (c-di-GMP phosphodiesterase class II)
VIDVSGNSASIQAQVESVHASLLEDLPEIGRVAVAVYDGRTDTLKTFVHSTRGETPFTHYEAKLADVPSLAELAKSRGDRIIGDLHASGATLGRHDRHLLESGYSSSYTKPFFDRGELSGFMFFDSEKGDYFSKSVVRHLAIYSHLISLLIINAMASANVLRSAVDVARAISHLRDEETGAHLDRMSRYARMITKTLADRENLDDEFVEFVFLFAPLHDVGKIAIPDRILLKAGKLTPDEFNIMKTHVAKGVAIVDKMAKSFSIGVGNHMDVLYNIVRFHHESYDGSGYLTGLEGQHIPLEARIVSVADVFDALTTKRPYKDAWSNDDAFRFLDDLSGKKFDPDCVGALSSNREAVETIQKQFRFAKGEFEGFHEAYLDGV